MEPGGVRILDQERRDDLRRHAQALDEIVKLGRCPIEPRIVGVSKRRILALRTRSDLAQSGPLLVTSDELELAGQLSDERSPLIWTHAHESGSVDLLRHRAYHGDA